MALRYTVLTLFIVCSAADIFAVGKKISLPERICKPLLMPLLMLFYVLSVKSPDPFILLALLGGFLGDTFLLGSGVFFICGLLSFLIGHIFYITAFIHALNFAAIPPVFYLFILLYIAYAVVVLRSLLSGINKKDIPQIIIYMVFLLGMSFSALLRYWSVSGLQFWLPFIGSLFFIASDTILAFQTFKKTAFRGIGPAIMITYVLAQFMIVAGLIL